MAQVVPVTPGDSEQRISTTLDGAQYVLRVRRNTSDDARAGAWYMDAWERDGITPIAFGVKLVLGTFLGQTTNHPLFAGGMFLFPTDGSSTPPGLFDLGRRVLLIHFTIGDRIMSGLPVASESA